MEKPLYEDEQLKVDYLPNSVEDHELFIKRADSRDSWVYILPRAVLRDFARTPRGKLRSRIFS